MKIIYMFIPKLFMFYMIDLGILLPVLGVLFLVWASVFILFGETWQNGGAFAPVGLGIYLYYPPEPYKWLLLIPIIPFLVININAVLSKPKFSGWALYTNYALIIPIYIFAAINSTWLFEKESLLMSILHAIIFSLILIYIAKFWFLDPLMLFINQFYTTKKEVFETEITGRYIKGSGRAKSYFVNIRSLGSIETSGFFYLTVGFKKIEPNDKVKIVVKTGWLGTEYLSGFPKVLSRGISQM